MGWKKNLPKKKKKKEKQCYFGISCKILIRYFYAYRMDLGEGELVHDREVTFAGHQRSR